MVKGYRPPFAYVLTSVSKTSTTRIRYIITGSRTFVAGNINNLNYVGIIFITSHCNFDSFAENCPFLIYAAAHSRRFSGYYHLWNIHNILKESIVPRLSCNLTKDLIFQVLDLCIEFSDSHTDFSLEITYFYPLSHFFEAFG